MSWDSYYDPLPDPLCRCERAEWFLDRGYWTFTEDGDRVWVEIWLIECPDCGRCDGRDREVECVEVIDPWDGWEQVSA